MSSDYTTSVMSLTPVRVRASEPVSEPDRRPALESVQRNETSAANGQELPLNSSDRDGEVSKVESAVVKISDFVQNFQRDLVFSIDKDVDRLIVKVVDSETQEVIRQIPSEETLRIAKNLDSPESLILREQA